MPGRSYTSNDGYRFGFNGKENDEEYGAGGLTQDYGFRMYNPAIAKFLSVDPLTPSYPWYTPYQFAGNTPIQADDLDGLEERKVIKKTYLQGKEMVLTNIKNNELEDKQNKYLIRSFNQAKRSYSIFMAAKRDNSSYNLARYLEGKGGYDIISVNKIRGSMHLNTAEKRLKGNLFNQIEEFASGKGEGEFNTSFQASEFSVQSGGGISNDFNSAYGSFNLLSRGDFKINVKENGQFSFEGEIYFTFRDQYRWHPSERKHTIGSDTDLFANHSMMAELQKAGAENFHLRAYYKQSVAGSSKRISPWPMNNISKVMDSDEIDKHLSEYEDIAGEYYEKPEDTPLINDYRKEKK